MTTRNYTPGQTTRHARNRAARQHGRAYERDYRAGQAQGAVDYIYGCHAIPELASAGYRAGYARGYRRNTPAELVTA